MTEPQPLIIDPYLFGANLAIEIKDLLVELAPNGEATMDLIRLTSVLMANMAAVRNVVDGTMMDFSELLHGVMDTLHTFVQDGLLVRIDTEKGIPVWVAATSKPV